MELLKANVVSCEGLIKVSSYLFGFPIKTVDIEFESRSKRNADFFEASFWRMFRSKLLTRHFHLNEKTV